MEAIYTFITNLKYGFWYACYQFAGALAAPIRVYHACMEYPNARVEVAG